jgi:hypothetical protein
MLGIEFGLGPFGDLRLEKGGLVFTRRWWSDLDVVSAAWLGRGRARFSSQGSSAIRTSPLWG